MAGLEVALSALAPAKQVIAKFPFGNVATRIALPFNPYATLSEDSWRQWRRRGALCNSFRLDGKQCGYVNV